MAGIFGAQAAIAALFCCSLVSAIMTSTSGARAAELKVMSTVALTPALDELKPGFESNGNHLIIVYSTIAELKKRIEGGETADVIILSRPILDEFAAQGKVVQGLGLWPEIGVRFLRCGQASVRVYITNGK